MCGNLMAIFVAIECMQQNAVLWLMSRGRPHQIKSGENISTVKTLTPFQASPQMPICKSHCSALTTLASADVAIVKLGDARPSTSAA